MTVAKKLQEVRAELAALGIEIKFNAEFNEYRVNFKGGREASANYTPDLEDALGSGKAMAAWRVGVLARKAKRAAGAARRAAQVA